MKVLIVDDNFKMREMLRSFLQDVTDEFCECDDGAKALLQYTDFHPDWVLMDWEMKEMDGLTATKQIIKKFPEANILLVTQYDDVELKVAASEAGASGYVLKDDLQSLRLFIAKKTMDS